MNTGIATTGGKMGTAAYMAPELHQSEVDADGNETDPRPERASDVFALAMLMWEVRIYYVCAARICGVYVHCESGLCGTLPVLSPQGVVDLDDDREQ
jgi:serine/threonine protein kinase